LKDEKKKKIQKEEAKRAEELEREQRDGGRSIESRDNDQVKKLIKIGDQYAQKGTSFLFTVFNFIRLVLRGIYNFLKQPTNFIDVANIIILMWSIIVWIIFVVAHGSRIDMGSAEFFADPANNHHIEDAVSWFKLYQRIVSLNLILTSFKFLKYLGIMVERVTVMFRVINHARSDIIYFFILYLIIFISFTTTFHIFYGSQVERFSTYGDSFNTLFLYLGRNILQIDEMKEMSFNFTVIYFIIFITSMDFILMNMFIAIIALSYSTVNKQMKEVNNEKILEHTHWSVTLYGYYKSIRKWLRKLRAKGPDKKEKAQSPHSEKESEQPEHSEDESKQPDDSEEEQDQQEEPSPEDDSNKEPGSKSDEDSKNEHDEIGPEDVSVALDDDRVKTKIGSDNRALSQSNLKSVYSQANSDIDNEEDDDEGAAKIDNKEEDEAIRQELLKMDWNKEFSLDDFRDKNRVDEAVQSEREVLESNLRKEKELGKKLWSLIGYICFFGFFSYLAFSQVRVSMFSMYNDALKNSIEDPLVLTTEDVYHNITQLEDFREVREWISRGLTQIYEVSADGQYYFINDYNYIIEESLRFCFQRSKPETSKGKGPVSAEWDRGSGGVDTQDFIGDASGFEYKYTSDGFQGQGSHCRIFNLANYETEKTKFIDDGIIGDSMRFLSIEMVTYEASNSFYTYSAIIINLKSSGELSTKLDIASIDIRRPRPLDVPEYDSWYDWIRTIFEITFIVITLVMIYFFYKRKRNILALYHKWENEEINHLLKIRTGLAGKRQRWKNRPEIFRKIWSLIDFFTIFEVAFFILIGIIS